MTQSLSIALKEWHLVISGLLAGRWAILLRKGGILESDNQFELEHPRFLFYPTYIHQDPRMTKPEFRGEIQSVAAEPDTIELRGYGEAAAIFQVPSRRHMDALFDLHPWDTPLIDMRFAYRAEKPLYLVVIRPFALAAAVKIANTLAYAGCRSWVPLQQAVSIASARQAMDEPRLQDLIARIRETFSRR